MTDLGKDEIVSSIVKQCKKAFYLYTLKQGEKNTVCFIVLFFTTGYLG